MGGQGHPRGHARTSRKPTWSSRTANSCCIGAHITPLTTASTHVNADPTRTRKLLLHREEINRLVGKVERAGYTLAPLDLHYKNGRVKIEIGLAKGKKQHDKRDRSRSASGTASSSG